MECRVRERSGKVALVTGSASGIGAATVEVLLRDGWRVVGCDRQEPLVPIESANYIPLVGEVTDPAMNERAVGTAVERFGQLDGLALTAGIVTTGEIETQAIDEFDKMVEVNLKGPILGVRAALPALRRSDQPSVVMTASVSGMGGDPQLWAYGATKAGVINLVRALAFDLGPSGVRVNAIAPGPVESPINERTRKDHVERAKEIGSSVPLQRWGKPHEVGEAIAFLLSSRSSFVTGTLLPVDGGVTAGSGQFKPMAMRL
jgi:meso-butanediol dehydrogenase/(S,S)-butanediol dehydrogenase/diacetyl reductase